MYTWGTMKRKFQERVVETLRDFLQDQMRKRGMSARQFAELCGVSNTVISRAISKTKPTTPDITTLDKIARAIGVDVFSLIRLVIPDADDMDIEARITAQEIVRLPADERRFIMAFIRGAIAKGVQSGE